MRLKLSFASALLCIILFAIHLSSFAAPVDSVTIDRETQQVTISGSIAGYSNNYLSLTIMDTGYSKASMESITDEVFVQDVIHFAQTTTDANGRYQYSFRMLAPKGTYEIFVNHGGDDGFAVADKKINMFSAKEIEDALKAVNSAASVSELTEAIAEWEILFDFDKSYYDSYDEDEKAFVYAYIYNEKVLAGNAFSKTSDVRDKFLEACIFQNIKNAVTGSQICDILEKHKAFLQLDSLSVYDAYSGILDTQGKIAVCGKLCGVSGVDNVSQLKVSFSKFVILQAVKDLSSWTGLKTLLTNNSVILDKLDISAYQNLNDTSKVDKQVVGKAYASVDELCKDVNDKVASALYPVPDKGGNSGFSGGSSSSIPSLPVSNPAEPDPEIVASFSDVTSSHWAFDAVNELFERNIINGKQQGVFAPDDYVTREEFSKLLVVAFGLYNADAEAPFSDLDTAAWYYPYVASAYQSEVVNGMGDSFGIGVNITRQDIAVMACRVANIDLTSTSSQAFADDEDISDYAKSSVAALSQKGIISGVGNNMFAPKQNATRAQAAKILYELIRYKEGEA